jgi:hypothetical protein
MERIEVNVETGEVTVIQYTPEEEAAALAYAATVQEAVPPRPTLEELQAQLAALTSQIQHYADGNVSAISISGDTPISGVSFNVKGV